MQIFSSKKRYRCSSAVKIYRIKKLCKMDLSPDKLLVLILAIVFPIQVLSALRK